jgi:hypothetical protein
MGGGFSRQQVAHTRQPASAGVTASVTHRTNKIGAAEGFRTRGAEDARRTPDGVSPSTPPGVHHMRAPSASDRAASRDMACVRHAVPPQTAATRAANSPAGQSAEKGPAGAFPEIHFARNLAGGAFAPEAPRTRLGAANTQLASWTTCGARRPPSLLLVLGATFIDLWPVWLAILPALLIEAAL